MTKPALQLVQKVVVSVMAVGLLALAFLAYGWLGVAGVAGALVMWVLLYVSRMLQVMQRAAKRPAGCVESAVMLNARLRKRMPLLQVLAMTGALGEPLTEEGVQPEIFRWTDASQSSVRCEFVHGRLTNWSLLRPDADAPDFAP